MLRQKKIRLHVNILIIIAIVLGIIGLLVLVFDRNPGEKVVKEFYTHEQHGDLYRSYELFHSDMKEKFSKSDYMQQRKHIFFDHFGVDTFEFSLGKSTKLKTWQMEDTSEQLSTVYKIPVTKTYRSTFGNFSIQQEVFVAKEDNKWKLLWSYE